MEVGQCLMESIKQLSLPRTRQNALPQRHSVNDRPSVNFRWGMLHQRGKPLRKYLDPSTICLISPRFFLIGVHDPPSNSNSSPTRAVSGAQLFVWTSRFLLPLALQSLTQRTSTGPSKMLYLVGLGLSDETDITVKGLEVVKKAERVYLEAYTSILLVDQATLVRCAAGSRFRLLSLLFSLLSHPHDPLSSLLATNST